ncbi:methylthioadenosine phosphorylase [Beutenbergia cavernae DSM 12333]|uniref:Purine nucleoside phosphorylase n=1 Tax=Beutenbergia cavernae (strain ATCC BAA-8 / DSM 12333 / CCUG 43141 / JCM 11478 / NBRC 16432 / NCIMB 13614 / HKI 0122) TaxID=471853 RepID=C5C002_BEUC1|nr:S-methyl-5'-thioadenosine phosphorylase [Beutenbergia cavernae]ACQ81332.1 methylthioadenosine phosphorylase [Beutenbergia cavernae DSM 12333]
MDGGVGTGTPGTTEDRRPIGVIGGSGLYELLASPAPVDVTTPFGTPSEAPVLGELGGRQVAFLPRHGADHRFPPHRVPYRANLWALRALGVRQVVTVGAVGALVPDLARGAVVVPDQIIDLTSGREHTVFDGVGTVVHVPFADPYCPRGRAAALSALGGRALDVRDGGTLVVINGPRFSTRAESRRNVAAGGTVVGMTGMPEAALARELAMCCTNLALVTDADAGVDGGESVTHAAVLEEFARHLAVLRASLTDVVTALPHDGGCGCRHALDGFELPFALPGEGTPDVAARVDGGAPRAGR